MGQCPALVGQTAAARNVIGLNFVLFGHILVSRGGQGLLALGPIAVNGHGLESHLPGFDVGNDDVLHRGLVGQVDRFGNGSGEEGLDRGHHPDVSHVVDGTAALGRLEGTIENRQVLVL